MKPPSRNNSCNSDRSAMADPREAGAIERLLADDTVVAFCVASGNVFTLRRRRFDVPAGWVCLTVGADGPMDVLGAAAALERGDAEEFLFARLGLMPVRIVVTGLRSSDAYDAELVAAAGVHVLPERGELGSLRNRLAADARVIRIRDIERLLTANLRAGVEPIVRRSTMESLTAGDGRGELMSAARLALDTGAFAIGLSVGHDVDVRLDSPMFEHVRRTQDEAMRVQREQEALAPARAAQQEARAAQVDQAAALLAKLQTLTAQSPAASMPDLLRSFAEQERAKLYEALFARPAARPQAHHLVVACGDSLLVFDPRDAARPPLRMALSGAAGPVRSLTYDAATRRLLAGAATGVYVITPDDWRMEREVVVEGSPSVRGGFNAAALAGDAILASHSELGLWAWKRGAAAEGAPLFSPITRNAKAVRAVQMCGDRAWCAVDHRVLAWSADAMLKDSLAGPELDEPASPGPITALKVLDTGDVVVGDSDGRVALLSRFPQGERLQLHSGRGRAVESLIVHECDGVRRLFFADTSVCIHARVLGDSFAWRYEASGQTLRRAVVATDILAALTELRDRVLLFDLNEPARPSAVLLVSQLSGRSIQDVALI